MAIKITSVPILDNFGKLQNAPAVIVHHTDSAETVVQVGIGFPSPALGTVAGYVAGATGRTNTVRVHPVAILQASVGTLAGSRSPGGYTQDNSSFKNHHPGGNKSSDEGGNCSQEDGFITGGEDNPSNSRTTTIGKFPFAVGISGKSKNVGDLREAWATHETSSSATHAFNTAGESPTTAYTSATAIDKFPFAISSGTSVDTGGDLNNDAHSGTYPSPHDLFHGYKCGGYINPNNSSAIEKFPFAISSGNATWTMSLTSAKYGSAGVSSETHGFVVGGGNPAPSYPNTITAIDRFPFSAEVAATDVGDLQVNAARIHGIGFTHYGLITTNGQPGYPSGSNGFLQIFPFAISAAQTVAIGPGIDGYTETSNKDGFSGIQD